LALAVTEAVPGYGIYATRRTLGFFLAIMRSLRAEGYLDRNIY